MIEVVMKKWSWVLFGIFVIDVASMVHTTCMAEPIEQPKEISDLVARCSDGDLLRLHEDFCARALEIYKSQPNSVVVNRLVIQQQEIDELRSRLERLELLLKTSSR